MSTEWKAALGAERSQGSTAGSLSQGQSLRKGPSAKGFLTAKAAWCRKGLVGILEVVYCRFP